MPFFKKNFLKIRGGDGVVVGLVFYKNSNNFRRLRMSTLYERKQKLKKTSFSVFGTSHGIRNGRKDGLASIKIVAKNRNYICEYLLNCNAVNIVNLLKMDLKSIDKKLFSKKPGSGGKKYRKN